LARCLEATIPDTWQWLKHLDEEGQARVLGYWELAKVQGVDVGAVAALTLSQLIHILTQENLLSSKLGYPSRTQLKSATGRVPSLRNRVMHPVRPLILSVDHVGQVRDSLFVLEDMRDRLENLVKVRNEA
jgi:hypothetical protein